jgi:hypothetical protein
MTSRIAAILLGVTFGWPALAAESPGREVQGSAALALASLVGQRDPAVWSADRSAIKAMGNGNMKGSKPIRVTSDSVVCRAGNVDITRHRCELTFGKRVIPLEGRAAHELYATLLEAGVESEGAAGTSYVQVKSLVCLVEPRIVAQRSGGGAMCHWDAL